MLCGFFLLHLVTNKIPSSFEPLSHIMTNFLKFFQWLFHVSVDFSSRIIPRRFNKYWRDIFNVIFWYRVLTMRYMPENHEVPIANFIEFSTWEDITDSIVLRDLFEEEKNVYKTSKIDYSWNLLCGKSSLTVLMCIVWLYLINNLGFSLKISMDFSFNCLNIFQCLVPLFCLIKLTKEISHARQLKWFSIDFFFFFLGGEGVQKVHENYFHEVSSIYYFLLLLLVFNSRKNSSFVYSHNLFSVFGVLVFFNRFCEEI